MRKILSKVNWWLVIPLILGILIRCQIASADCVAKFSWLQNVDSVTVGYKICYSKINDGVYNDKVDVGKPPVIDGRIHGRVTEFECGETYYVCGVAYNKDGWESSYSNTVVITANVEIPDPPQDFRVEHLN